MIASVLALALLIGLAVADDSTIYVSPFGDDANDGLTPSTAVQTFARAWTRTKAKSFYHITVGAGVVRYSDVPIDHDLVVVSATGDPSLSKLQCDAGETLSWNNWHVSFSGLSLVCNKPLKMGNGYSSYSQALTLRNVVIDKMTTLVTVSNGKLNTVSLYDSTFTGMSELIQFDGYSTNVKISTHNVVFSEIKGSLFPFDKYSNKDGSLLFNNTRFDGTGPMNYGAGTYWIGTHSDLSTTMVDSTFVGLTSSACGVVLVGSKHKITNCEFADHEGAPALCARGGATVNVVSSDFTSNKGNTTANGAFPGAAIYVSENSNLALGASLLKSNSVDSPSGAPALYCSASSITVGQSEISYNKAPHNAPSACWNCQVVAFSNKIDHNSRVSSPETCNLDQ